MQWSCLHGQDVRYLSFIFDKNRSDLKFFDFDLFRANKENNSKKNCTWECWWNAIGNAVSQNCSWLKPILGTIASDEGVYQAV